MAMLRSEPRLVAVLGPTNTGKTHLAIERMLDHQSGMIGFPLRLLARENYDRVVKLRGARAVALITGEEKILPPNPSYFVCTVESMPLDRAVEFLAVDEIQLCADPERGHVFTARLLHARGLSETMFLGADTIRPLMRRLVPRAEYISRPRLSTLSYTGHKKVTRLPPRSAVVAFAVADVFSLAELVRRQRGGTAVVLGALSPRARNAQVGMFQAGEVDYLVATDAIGMGLNMDLDHVAFARLGKFDGSGPRRLSAAEIGQNAGRAGRHMSDGTFGTTAEEGPLDQAIVTAVEEHRFDALTRLSWRNTKLRFQSVGALLKSLDERPPVGGLIQTRDADDHRALQLLAHHREVMGLATHPGAVRLLWEVCQIPDFRKVMSDSHARFLAHCFVQLAGPEGRLPGPWIGAQMAQLDRLDGDIDTLMTRIAHVRTWTYITHRGAWVDGFRFVPDASEGAAMRTLLTAANRVLRTEVAARARRLANDSEEAFTLDAAGRLHWQGGPVGRLVAGDAILTPRVEVQASDFLDGELRERVRQRLQLFVKGEIERRLAPLFAMRALPLEGIGRGLVFQLVDSLGCLAVVDVAAPLRALDRQTRRALGRAGVRFGAESLYVEPLLGGETARFRALLWAVQQGRAVPPLPGARRQGRVIAVDPDLPASFYAAIGRRVLGGWALRPDRLERLATALRERARAGRFAGDAELASIAGVAIGELRRLVTALGYRAIIENEREFFIGKPRRRSGSESTRRRMLPRDGHPFAKLKELNFA